MAWISSRSKFGWRHGGTGAGAQRSVLFAPRRTVDRMSVAVVGVFEEVPRQAGKSTSPLAAERSRRQEEEKEGGGLEPALATN